MIFLVLNRSCIAEVDFQWLENEWDSCKPKENPKQNENKNSKTKMRQKFPQQKGLGMLSGKERGFWSLQIGREEN